MAFGWVAFSQLVWLHSYYSKKSESPPPCARTHTREYVLPFQNWFENVTYLSPVPRTVGAEQSLENPPDFYRQEIGITRLGMAGLLRGCSWLGGCDVPADTDAGKGSAGSWHL